MFCDAGVVISIEGQVSGPVIEVKIPHRQYQVSDLKIYKVTYDNQPDLFNSVDSNLSFVNLEFNSIQEGLSGDCIWRKLKACFICFIRIR